MMTAYYDLSGGGEKRSDLMNAIQHHMVHKDPRWLKFGAIAQPPLVVDETTLDCTEELEMSDGHDSSQVEEVRLRAKEASPTKPPEEEELSLKRKREDEDDQSTTPPGGVDSAIADCLKGRIRQAVRVALWSLPTGCNEELACFESYGKQATARHGGRRRLNTTASYDANKHGFTAYAKKNTTSCSAALRFRPALTR